MSTIAIGDVHGNCAALDDLLSQLSGELDSGDTVVFLGDYIDRGPDSKGCIDRILQLRAEGPADVVTLIGNHEDWLLRTLADPHRHSWLTVMEGFPTIASYSEHAAQVIGDAAEAAGPRLVIDPVALPYELFFDAMPREHLVFFQQLALMHRTVDAVCSHGGLDPVAGAPEEQTRDALIWGTSTFPSGYAGPDLLLYGHWNNCQVDEDGWPRPAIAASSIGIDTISHGVLTAVRVPDRRVFQSKRFA
jgi:serine/threonine protein phosphatase 1